QRRNRTDCQTRAKTESNGPRNKAVAAEVAPPATLRSDPGGVLKQSLASPLESGLDVSRTGRGGKRTVARPAFVFWSKSAGVWLWQNVWQSLCKRGGRD